MKKNFTLIAFLLCSVIGLAQIPSGYYSSATGSGYTLKTQLFNIIKGHTDLGYAGLYVTYTTSDIDLYYENNGTMLDMYTENPTGPDTCEYTYGVNQDDGSGGTAECQKYNREHIVPQSVFGSATPMYSDAHFVVPSDKYVNGQRGNDPFGRVNVPTNTYSNGSKKGNNLNSGYSAGYSSIVFEPINEFKGDIARMFFYFATRYENQVAGWSYPMFNGTSNQVFTNTFLNILITWHNNDPVSQRERDRNNAIYARQNNRNPFIDHPEYVCQIYPTQCATLSSDNFILENVVSIYPNPAVNYEITISSEVELNSIVLYNINGQIIQEIKNPTRIDNSYKVNNLQSGFYLVQLTSENATTSKKIIVN
ncbi:endonuclease [Flavobacterium sp. HXWNR69]|uniref:Endonuclease n=1 Tax=Flavobacterium fragile TaxID=2949085 RepID=A0ABT0TJH0_9FLAO|nr:endonuclease [Flavobacterium sp. HXWNR69]MCL9770957.1 endonuclease [Flavobacterium sp. HXWNR69]